MQTTHTGWQTIGKAPHWLTVVPHLLDYERTWRDFTWPAATDELAGPSGSRGLNLAHLALDRHASGPRRDHLALRWLGNTVSSGT
jgi:acetyl-CoA synthetase